METLNYLHDESLIVELKPEEAEIMQGGVSYETYTTKGVSSYLNIRSGPGIGYPSIGRWYPGQRYNLQIPAIVKNGFRKFGSSLSAWVSTRYIKPA